MPPAVHWDEVEKERSDDGAFRSAWSVLGEAAGSVTVNVNRIEIDPGARSTPLHMENAEEEIFFVLGGSGLSWQQERGAPEQTFEIRARGRRGSSTSTRSRKRRKAAVTARRSSASWAPLPAPSAQGSTTFASRPG